MKTAIDAASITAEKSHIERAKSLTNMLIKEEFGENKKAQQK